MPRKKATKPNTQSLKTWHYIGITILVFGIVYLVIRNPSLSASVKSFFNSPLVLTIVGGLIVGVIVLYMEYGFFQRNKTRSKTRRISKQRASSNRNIFSLINNIFRPNQINWNRAIDVAVVIFKDRMDKYNWVDEQVSVEKISKGKHFATFNVIITTHKFAQPVILEKYSLRINATGDILEMNPISLIGENN